MSLGAGVRVGVSFLPPKDIMHGEELLSGP